MSNRRVRQVRAEIEKIAAANDGVITPEMIVAYARDNPLSALHRIIEWNDTKAAEQWRLSQAAMLIRKYVIKVEGDDGETIKIRGFVSLPSDRGAEGTYRSTLRVLSDEEQTAELIATALVELNSFRTKYAAIRKAARMAPVFEAIDEALAG
jgi:hypothetical protein